jgi:hypothetical protein
MLKDHGFNTKERYSPYKDLPVTPGAASTANYTSSYTSKYTSPNLPFSASSSSSNANSNTHTTTTATVRKNSSNDLKGPRGIKNELVGGFGLANMGRDTVYQSTIIGEGPIFESKRVLEPASPYIPPDNRFAPSNSLNSNTGLSTNPRQNSF